MEKANRISEFNQKAIYEFVNRNGFKNVAECIAHFGINEFKRLKNQFLIDYKSELQSRIIVKPKRKIPIAKKTIAPKKRNKQDEFHLRLITIQKLVLSDLQEDSSLKLNQLAEYYGINKEYLYALVKLKIIQNNNTKYFPDWKIVEKDFNWNEIAIKTKKIVNQNNYESRQKNLKP